MATTAEKQLWLVGQGKPKSYSYFMTGGTMSDWDWDQAIAGSYNTGQIQTGLAEGETAYKASKKASAEKKAAKADGPSSGPSTSCAKTAAKSIVSWVGKAVQNANAWYNDVAHGLSTGGEVLEKAAAYRKVLSAQIAEAIEEVGDQASEVQAMLALRDLMDDVEVAREARLLYLELSKAALDQEGPEVVTALMFNMNRVVKRLSKVDATKAAPLFDDIWSFPNKTLSDLKFKADALAKREHARATGAIYKRAALDDELVWTSIDMPSPFKPGTEIPISDFEMFTKVSEKIHDFSLVGLDPNDAEEIIETMFKLRRVEEVWNNQFSIEAMEGLTNHPGAPVTFLRGDMQRMNLLGSDVADAVGNNINAYGDLLHEYKKADWWLEGPFGNLDESPLAALIQKVPAGSTPQQIVLKELDDFKIEVNGLSNAGNFGGTTDHGVGSFYSGLFNEPPSVIEVLDDALDAAKGKLAGLTPTKADVLEAMPDGFKTQILSSSTDDLNIAAQAALEAQDESKSLVYFMTKAQKQDVILLPKAVFDATEYVVKYKGDELTGAGLATAKEKIAIKSGKVKPKVEVPKPTTAVVDTTTGAVETWTIPPGSPSWWADPVSDAQSHFIFKAVSQQTDLPATGFGQAWANSAGPDLVEAGTMLKGQASGLIGEIKGGKTVWTADEIDELLSFGKKKAATTAKEAEDLIFHNIPEPDISDITAGIKSVEAGGAVADASGGSSAAPLHANWDEPHTFTYVGDGQAKWGGAHRKYQFTDETGADWMLKHGELFRHEGELAAHKVAHALGFDIAEARISRQSVAGRQQTGFMQKMYRKDEIRGELGDLGAFASLDDDIIRQVQEHQVLDWLTGNHDAHAQNFLVMSDGRVVGIDKGQAFKFMGKDKLAHDYAPQGNFGEVQYNRMWSDYRAGKIDLDLDSISDVLRRIEALDDDAYAALIREYAEGRFRVNAGLGFHRGTTARSADQLVDLAVKRKRNIRKEFTKFYKEQANARGTTWAPSWEKARKVRKVRKVVTEVKPGGILTPIDEAFSEALQRAGTAGKAIFSGSSDLERGQVLFDIVIDSQGKQVLRMNAHLRPDADKRLLTLLRAEGGDKITQAAASAAPLPSTPHQVISAGRYATETLSGAKTVNHHISQGDFAFNQATVERLSENLNVFSNRRILLAHIEDTEVIFDEVVEEFVESLLIRTGPGKGGVPAGLDRADFIDSEIVRHFGELAGDATELKAINTFESHMRDIVDQAAKGKAAAKVGQVPHFDAGSHYEAVKDSAVKRARVITGDSVGKHIEVVEPDKVFTALSGQNQHITTMVKFEDYTGDFEQFARLVDDSFTNIGVGEAVGYRGATSDGIEMIYRQIDGSDFTLQGWMELKIVADGDTITLAEIERAYDFLTKRVGVRAALGTAQDAELVFWRQLQGSYRYSIEAGRDTSKYSKALRAADDNVRALGANPTKQAEIDAIRSAWRAEFGRVIDDADVLPIYKHKFRSDAEEFGWGHWERPELGDLNDLKGTAVIHDTAYGDGIIDERFFQGPLGDGMLSQSERQRIGMASVSRQTKSDVKTGGASGVFGRITNDGQMSVNYMVYNPASLFRRLGSYNANTDTFGRMAKRPTHNKLSAKAWRGNAAHGNEVMSRDNLSIMDDLEIAFFNTRAGAEKAVASARRRGVSHIRGVPVEERLVFEANPGRYQREFFRKYVYADGFSKKLRRMASEIIEGTKKAITKAAFDLTSRLKTKIVRGQRVLGKKLSTGRHAAVRISGTPNDRWNAMAIRYHDVENAISISVDTLNRAGLLGDAAAEALPTGLHVEYAAVEKLMKQVGIKSWAYPDAEVAFQLSSYSKYNGRAVIIDLSEWGVDLKSLSQYERPQVLREFVQAVNDRSLVGFKAKWGV